MAIFEASPEGFRSLNLGRPAAHLVREAVQNVFDEAASFCRVEVKHTPAKGVYIKVEDDVVGGIRDEKLVFTIWMSDKQDTPTKRGRMGRGLKELVSVSDWTCVRTEGRDAIEFQRDRVGEWKRSQTGKYERPARGTVVECQVKAWSKKDAADIVGYLKRVRPPNDGFVFEVNGEQVTRCSALESYKMSLPSVVFEISDNERKESNRAFETTVDLFSEEKAHVYEMGLPIEEIDFPLSIDIQQRVPLREKRDTLLDYYRKELYAKLLDKRIAHLPAEQLKDNYVLEAAKAAHYLGDDAKKRIAEAWTEGRPYASTPQMVSIATGQHIPVVNLRSLPESVRDIVKGTSWMPGVGQDVRTVLDARREEFCPEVKSLTSAQQRLKNTWEWIARGIKRPCTVKFVRGDVGAVASFERATATLSIYVEVVDPSQFPLRPKALSTFIHELSHWTAVEDSHGEDFHSDAEDVGALVASFLVEHAEQALAMAQQGES